MQMRPLLETLPVTHYREIGRIVTHWARLEWMLRQIGYGLLDIGPKHGRIAVREPRLPEQISMIEDLLALRRQKVATDFKKLRSDIEILQTHRDRIVHGIWIQMPKGRAPVLQVTRGKWQPNPAKPKVQRKLTPQGIPLAARDLHELVLSINKAIKDVIQLAREIDALPESSLHKSNER